MKHQLAFLKWNEEKGVDVEWNKRNWLSSSAKRQNKEAIDEINWINWFVFAGSLHAAPCGGANSLFNKKELAIDCWISGLCAAAPLPRKNSISFAFNKLHFISLAPSIMKSIKKRRAPAAIDLLFIKEKSKVCFFVWFVGRGTHNLSSFIQPTQTKKERQINSPAWRGDWAGWGSEWSLFEWNEKQMEWTTGRNGTASQIKLTEWEWS